MKEGELRIDYGNMYYENVDLKNQIAELQAQLKEQTLANKELNEQLDAVLEVSERFDKDIDVNLDSGIDFNLDEELMDLDERQENLSFFINWEIQYVI